MAAPVFKFHKPSAQLRKYIRFYLDAELDEDQFLRNSSINYPTIFPAMNIVYSEKTNDFRVGENVYNGYRIFVGGLTRLSSSFLTHNKLKVISAFFYPYGFQHIFNMSIHDMAHCLTALEKLDPEDAPVLLDNILKESDDKRRIKDLDDYLLKKLSVSDWSKPYLDTAVDLILSSRANITVKDIIEKIRVPERTLRRRFYQDMGMNIKEFIDIARINFASVILTSNPERSTQNIVHELGYYDQSHFLKHLKKYLGISSSSFTELKKTFLYHYSGIELSNPLENS